MKKILIFLSAITLANCSDSYDDSKLWNSVNGLENRVTKLEELCKQMNTNISSLQEIVTALQKNESIKSVATLPDGSGYLITFSSGKTITIYHGKNGVAGEDGKDGQNGKDGTTPTISVKKDIDGIYYWTVDNDWLLVDGKKVKAEGTDGTDGGPGKDGEDGTNGKDGVTPQFKITDGYWYVSYDNEQSWTKLGKATGDSGLNGADGDNFFKGVSIEDGYVCFTLNDKDATIIKLPFVSESELTIEVKEPGTLKSLLTDEDMRTVISLKLVGSLNDDDFATIRYWMFVVENVDLSETDISEVPKNAFKSMPRLRKVIIPNSCSSINVYAFSGCPILEFIIAPSAEMPVSAIASCPNIQSIAIGNIKGDMSLNINEITLMGDIEGVVNCGKINSSILNFGKNVTKIISSFSESQISEVIFDIDASISEIEDKTFSGNQYIQSITFSKNLTTLGKSAFQNCINLENVTFPEDCNISELFGYISIYDMSTRHIYGPFAECNKLKTIELPENLTTIRGSVFYGSSNLETIILRGANTPCQLLTNYSYNDAWHTGDRAYPFYSTKLSQVISYKIQPPVCENSQNVFYPNNLNECTLYVPKQSIEKYKAAWGWKDFGTILPIEE